MDDVIIGVEYDPWERLWPSEVVVVDGSFYVDPVDIEFTGYMGAEVSVQTSFGAGASGDAIARVIRRGAVGYETEGSFPRAIDIPHTPGAVNRKSFTVGPGTQQCRIGVENGSGEDINVDVRYRRFRYAARLVSQPAVTHRLLGQEFYAPPEHQSTVSLPVGLRAEVIIPVLMSGWANAEFRANVTLPVTGQHATFQVLKESATGFEGSAKGDDDVLQVPVATGKAFLLRNPGNFKYVIENTTGDGLIVSWSVVLSRYECVSV